MREPIYIAGALRGYGIAIPDHIPDYAWIFQSDTKSDVSGQVRSFGTVTSVMIIPVFPPEKFHFYPKHTNARQLISRNSREGLYCGIHNEVTHFDGKHCKMGGARHRRQGKIKPELIPARYCKKYFDLDDWPEFWRRLHIMTDNGGRLSKQLIASQDSCQA